jgi:hypothetical protein
VSGEGGGGVRVGARMSGGGGWYYRSPGDCCGAGGDTTFSHRISFRSFGSLPKPSKRRQNDKFCDPLVQEPGGLGFSPRGGLISSIPLTVQVSDDLLGNFDFI